MPRPNDNYAPTCPICCHTLKKNGTVKTHVKVKDGNLTTYLPKQRWRCYYCNYSETTNREAHNANIRTGYGITKLSNLAVPYRTHTHTKTLNPNLLSDTCKLTSGVKTDDSENATNRASSINQAQPSDQTSQQ
jgi:hypothetical protein